MGLPFGREWYCEVVNDNNNTTGGVQELFWSTIIAVAHRHCDRF